MTVELEAPRTSIATALFPDMGGQWFSVLEDDPRALALYLRHYSSQKARGRRGVTPLRGNGAKFVGPGASIVLLTAASDALFVWRKQDYRKDGQLGVECSIFRNEGHALSSHLIGEADEIAWRRWPTERLFTFVWDDKVRSINPGYCFKKAGWRVCGRNADGRLTILDILPTTATPEPGNGLAADSSAQGISGAARHQEDSDATALRKPGQAFAGRRAGQDSLGRDGHPASHASTTSTIRQDAETPDRF